MVKKDILKRLGLPKHSYTIYSLLKKRSLLVSEIYDLTQIHRPAIYNSLFHLQNHGFIFKNHEGKRNYYSATDEKLILKEFKSLQGDFEKEFDTKFKKSPVVIENVTTLHGPEGIRKAFDDAISNTIKAETFCRYTSEKDLTSVNQYLSKDYRINRDRKRLERMVISNQASGTQKKNRLERFIRYIDQTENFDQNIIKLIYGERVSIIDLNTETVLIIKNKNLADFERVIFKKLYSALPRPVK